MFSITTEQMPTADKGHAVQLKALEKASKLTLSSDVLSFFFR